VQSVKKQQYLFHVSYQGKRESLSDWRKQVDTRTTQTLKFMNLARTLRIIRYDPSQYMNAQKIATLAKGERPDSEQRFAPLLPDQSAKSVDPRAGLIQTTRKNSVGQNPLHPEPLHSPKSMSNTKSSARLQKQS